MTPNGLQTLFEVGALEVEGHGPLGGGWGAGLAHRAAVDAFMGNEPPANRWRMPVGGMVHAPRLVVLETPGKQRAPCSLLWLGGSPEWSSRSLPGQLWVLPAPLAVRAAASRGPFWGSSC